MVLADVAAEGLPFDLGWILGLSRSPERPPPLLHHLKWATTTLAFVFLLATKDRVDSIPSMGYKTLQCRTAANLFYRWLYPHTYGRGACN